MRRTFFPTALAAATLGISMAATPMVSKVTVEHEAPRPVRQKENRGYSGPLKRKYRNRWKASKPPRRPNRLHISRRVKRRHRRAA